MHVYLKLNFEKIKYFNRNLNKKMIKVNMKIR